MAENYVSNFHITTEDGEEYDAQAKDPEAVETNEGEVRDTIVTYDYSEGDEINSFTDFITNYVNGTKIGRWFKNFKAGVEFLLHVGSLVNDCVSDNSDLPLAASQGKVLMDMITELNDNLTQSLNDFKSMFNGCVSYEGTGTYTIDVSSESYNPANNAYFGLLFVFHRGGVNYWLGALGADKIMPIASVGSYFSVSLNDDGTIDITSGQRYWGYSVVKFR